MNTVSTLLVSISVTTAPAALFSGITLIVSVRSMMMSASLPGVSVPTLAVDVGVARALDRRHLEDLAAREKRREVLFAGQHALVEQRPLQRERGAHHREHVGGHVRFDVHAQARRDAVIERLLDRRHPVPHLHLDRRRDRHVPAGIGDHLPRGLAQLRAVDVLVVGLHEAGLAHRLEAGGVADDVVDDRRADLPGERPGARGRGRRPSPA